MQIIHEAVKGFRIWKEKVVTFGNCRPLKLVVFNIINSASQLNKAFSFAAVINSNMITAIIICINKIIVLEQVFQIFAIL
jgi:hypothetical protein